MEKIQIWWEGPFKPKEIFKSNNKNKNINQKIGIYQIYGFHPLYGSDVLLYIGRTKNKQGFQSRLKNRWEIEDGQDNKNIRIYLGCILSDEKNLTEDEIEKLIERAEVLMINMLKPAFNSSNVKSARIYDKENYIVENYGNYRKLYPIFSSEYFWKEFKNRKFLKEIIENIKNDETFSISKTDDEENEGYYIDKHKTIWIGIDEYIWDEYNSPLQIALFKKKFNERNIEKIGEKIEFLNNEEADSEFDCKKYHYVKIDLVECNTKDLIEKLKQLLSF